MLVPARRQGRAAGRSSVRATLNRGSAREGCPQRNAGSYVGRNRARARQAANDPIELAARHVQVWETAGERWTILSGEAAVLQAGDGLRARAAVVRIIEVPMEDGKGYQAEIYAEG